VKYRATFHTLHVSTHGEAIQLGVHPVGNKIAFLNAGKGQRPTL
jgi:hypothetical protein